MKKFFAAILTVFLSLGLLTACGGGQQHGASSAPAVQSVERSDTGSADKSKSRIRQNKIYTDFDAVQSSENADKGSTNKEKISRQSYTGSTSVSQSGEQFSAKSPGNAEIRVERDQAYTDKDHVAAYIHIYRKLPPNYITKAEARSLGWKDKGTLDQVAPGKSIGGDRFSNYEKSSLTLRGAAGKNATLTTSGGTGTRNVSVSPTMALSTTPHPTIRILKKYIKRLSYADQTCS